jgi:hypothetical protein
MRRSILPRPVPAIVRVIYPPELTWQLRLAGEPVVLGRQPDDGTPALGHATVSRRHAQLWWDGRGQHAIRDLGSRHGTRAGDAVIGDAPRALRDGDVLRLGDVLAVYERLGEPDNAAVDRAMIPGDAAAIVALRGAVARAAADPVAGPRDRRDRQRQGVGRPRAAPAVGAPRAPGRGQLRDPVARAGRESALRSRPRRLHRRDRRSRRLVPPGSPRQPVPRRAGRAAAGAPAQAAPGPAGRSGHAGRRRAPDRRRRPGHRRHQSRARGRGRGRHLPPRPAGPPGQVDPRRARPRTPARRHPHLARAAVAPVARRAPPHRADVDLDRQRGRHRRERALA